MNDQPAIVCLGRYGDIVNVLPIAWHLAQTAGVPKFCVSEEFWTILDGVSYVQPVVWPVDYKELPWAIKRVAGRSPEAIIAQAYMHPDQSRKTESYQMEAWRMAGYLDQFGKFPLVFDKRNPAREKELDLKMALLTNPFTVNKATILVASKSVSSPYRDDLLGRVRKEFPGYNVVDLSALKSPRIYDLIGIIENSACLVTVDSVQLHLARATKTPVIALINEGWFGSVPQGNIKSTIRYSEALANPTKVIEAIKSAIK